MNPEAESRVKMEIEEAQDQYHKEHCPFYFDAEQSTPSQSVYVCPDGYQIIVYEDCGTGA